MIMEQLCRVELIGIVGNAKVQKVGDSKLLRMSVVTNYAYKTPSSEVVIESTWHNVSAFENEHVPDVESYRKGDKVHVIGRISNQRFMTASGEERTCAEIRAQSMERIDGSEVLTCQF